MDKKEKTPQKKRDKQRTLIIVLIFLIVFTLVVITLSLKEINSYKNPMYIKTIPMQINLSNKTIGFDVGTDLLRFGMVNYDSSSKRSILIENAYDFPVRIVITCTGEICPYLTPNSSEIYLMPKERLSLLFSVKFSKDTEQGEYLGEIEFQIYKVPKSFISELSNSTNKTQENPVEKSSINLSDLITI